MNWFRKKTENQVYWVKKLYLQNDVFSYMICVNVFTRKEVTISVDNHYSYFSFDKLVDDIKKCKKNNIRFKLNLSLKRKKNMVEIKSHEIIPIKSPTSISLKIFNIKKNIHSRNTVHKKRYQGMKEDDACFFWVFGHMSSNSYETTTIISNLERVSKGYNAGLYISLIETSLKARTYNAYLNREMLKGAIHRELKKIQRRKLPVHIEVTDGYVTKMKITNKVMRKANEEIVDYSNPFD